jgi:hypothetical protein
MSRVSDMRRLKGIFLFLLLLLVITGGALAQSSPSIDRWFIGGGGAQVTGGNISISGALGQAAAGPSSGGDVTIASGFWVGGLTAMKHVVYLPLTLKHWPPPPEAPMLQVINNPGGDGSYTLHWSSSDLATFYVLQEAKFSDFRDKSDIHTENTSYNISGRGTARYYYHVNAHNSVGSSSWSNVESVDVLWEAEDNDSYQEANGPLQSSMDYYGYPNDNKDYFSIYLTTSGTINIDLTNYTGQGGQLQLFYQSTDKLVSVDKSSPYHIEHAGESGWYYIYIYTESGHNSDTQYILQATFP